MPVSRKKAVDFNALTPRDIFENITNHYDCTGRVSFALFSFPVSSIKSVGLRRENDSVIEIKFDCATMQLFHMITEKFGLQPKFDGYGNCKDNRYLIFDITHKDDEINQVIYITCSVSSWNLSTKDKEQFHELKESVLASQEKSDA
tara:strand:- start:67 stop:504 length:438 start_codon:yes stop_codon:yes gene_type:complete